MADKMAVAMDWFADKMAAHASRPVTYRGVRNGVRLSIDLDCGIGTSQLTQINSLGIDSKASDFTLQNASEMDRDYIAVAAEMGVLWPPVNGDFVDDENDEVGVTKRFVVKSIPGQPSFRWLRGGYQKQARIHTKFFQDISTYWSDAFTGTTGTDLTSHIPEQGVGYAGGTGTVEINANRIIATTPTAYRYFDAGETETTAIIDFSLNTTAGALDGKHVELGLGVRTAMSGAGLRDGYYCTIKVGYAGPVQTATLKIQQRLSGVTTTVATLTLSDVLSLTETYRLAVTNADTITLTLADSTGEVAIASVSYATPLFPTITGHAVYFDHHATLADPSLSWMDDLTVEAA